ncbi:M20/M25/M40 family metallo-hydrolase [Actinoplanes sp. NPDC051494]|uniref:M20/M25/M40 family metallo-hydrolase n=1 Tax=Actinoplanes sp. NPDC051494 TaxID=3363907 RepID=UPI003794C821
MTVQQDVRDFLTSRRARITPQRAGLSAYDGRRRVPGLRREEVALLAGVSVDYYNRLERGNLRGVSEPVLDAIARVLLLDEAEHAHLHDLARTANTTPAKRRSPATRQVRPALQRLLDAMTEAPSLIVNGRMDILAANHLGRALYAEVLDHREQPGNLAHFGFLSPHGRGFFPDWDRTADDAVATLRSTAGSNPYDRDLSTLVDELSTRSEPFRTRWASHNVRFHRTGTKRFGHALAGDLTLAYETMDLTADPGLVLLAYTASTSAAEDALRVLTLSPASPASRSGCGPPGTPHEGAADGKSLTSKSVDFGVRSGQECWGMTVRRERSHPTRRTLLSASAAVAAVPVLAAASPARAGAAGLRKQEPDRELKALLQEIDPYRIEVIVKRLAGFGTRHTLSRQDDPVRGIGAARDWIHEQFQAIAANSGGRMTVELQSYVQPPASRIPVPTRITNIVATLRGTDEPGRVYVVTGHYDSRATDVMDATSDAPGADDDASGVAAVLEVARVMAARGTQATVVFAAVAGEEQGLYGSDHLAQQLKDAGTDVQAMFSNDIVGTGDAHDGTAADPRTVRLFVEGVPTAETPAQASTRLSVGGENDGASRQLGRFVRDVAENPQTGMKVRVIWRRDRYLRGSDHISFLLRGYPAARFTEPRENFAHEHQDVRTEDGVRYGDLVEFCDFRYIARVARVNAAALWSLAQAPGTPKGVVIDTTRLTNETTLRWQASLSVDLAGYEIVWRETTAPDWQHVLPVGNVTTATVDLSKDNVFFGVRAIDHDGHRSPVAAPLPG